jgi:hypothetical protein
VAMLSRILWPAWRWSNVPPKTMTGYSEGIRVTVFSLSGGGLVKVSASGLW